MDFATMQADVGQGALRLRLRCSTRSADSGRTVVADTGALVRMVSFKTVDVLNDASGGRFRRLTRKMGVRGKWIGRSERTGALGELCASQASTTWMRVNRGSADVCCNWALAQRDLG